MQIASLQLEKGSATVPVALFGVSPNRWPGKFHSLFDAQARVPPGRRRDADESGRDDRAPHLQLHRSTVSKRYPIRHCQDALSQLTGWT